MKKLLALGLTVALLAVSAGSAKAAGVTVGSFDSGNCYPFNCNDSGTSVGPSIDYQQVYNSANFSGPITIKSLTFFSFPGFPFEVLGGDYNITLSTTSAAVNGLSTFQPSNVGPDVATFFNGHISGGPIGSTFTITGAPFTYNPANGNLLMEVAVSNQDNVPNGAGNGYFWADYTGTQTQRSYAFLGSPNGTGSLTGAIVTGFDVVPEPASLTLLGLGVVGLVGYARRRQKATA
jgi:hypothetical protein